jgi:type IV pilus assembly protein PilQ
MSSSVAEITKNTDAKVAKSELIKAKAPNNTNTQPEVSLKAEGIIKSKVYTGEKIAIDFFNTDIRNVFRIIADVSGENFAIDKDVQGQITLNLNKPVPWDRVLDLVLKMNQLEQEREQGITRIATLATLEAEKKARIHGKEAAAEEEQARVRYLEAKRAIERLQPLETVYLQVNYADAKIDVEPQIEPLLSRHWYKGRYESRGRVSIDKRNNVVILTDVPSVIERARATVLKIDQLVPQVLIEARIVEASTDFTREIGLSWGMTTGIQSNDPRAGIGPQRGFDLFGGTYGWDTAVNHPFSSGTPMQIGFNIARIAGSPFGLNARLRALEVNGTGKIISSPKVLSRDNQEAIITQGREYPYFEESESGGTTVKFKKVELKLTVLPNITPDNRIAIKLKIEKKDVLSFVANVPILSSREAESEFLMNDGDTLVIGGIHKVTNRLSESGFPWLSKIPLLGWLFKTKNKELDKEELLIFITPKIMTLEQRRPVVENS